MPFADEQEDEELAGAGGSAGYRPVGWDEIQPPRPYRSDASATSGRIWDGSGLRPAASTPRWMWKPEIEPMISISAV